MHHHAWIIEVLIDIAKYSEKNGLADLHLELCALLSQLVSANCGGEPGGPTPEARAADNVVHLASYANA